MAKINRRDDRSAGHLMFSVPADWIPDVESALTFLEETERETTSRVIRDAVLASARAKGWKPKSRSARPRRGSAVASAVEVAG